MLVGHDLVWRNGDTASKSLHITIRVERLDHKHGGGQPFEKLLRS